MVVVPCSTRTRTRATATARARARATGRRRRGEVTSDRQEITTSRRRHSILTTRFPRFTRVLIVLCLPRFQAQPLRPYCLHRRPTPLVAPRPERRQSLKSAY